ncbi:MAG: OB-fold domain-containing protein [Oscillospiraceae bacterium]
MEFDLPVLPKISYDIAPFFKYCNEEHKFMMQKCTDCGKFRWPAAFICPDCLSEAYTWEELKGTGTIYSYIVYRRAFQPDFEGHIPYVVATVDLDEGPRFITWLVNCEPEDADCGKRVKLVWLDDKKKNFSLPAFELI